MFKRDRQGLYVQGPQNLAGMVYEERGFGELAESET